MKRLLPTLAAAALIPSATAAPSLAALDLSRLRTLDGAAANGQFSISCVVVGDMDGDGFPEYAVGASADATAGPGAGRVFIYRGGASHLGDPPAWIIDGLPNDLLGASLAAAGDVDGDGLADLLIGAPASVDNVPTAKGRALLVFGSRPLGARAPVSIAGPVAGGQFGAAVAGLGDFDGDGFPDFAVGAPRANNEAGEVLIYRGGPGVPAAAAFTLHGRAGGDDFGAAVAGAGRTHGGAVSDLLVGAPFNSDASIWSGKVYLYFGGVPPDTLPDHQWSGANFGDFFGTAVAGVGDVNGDGFADVLVGAPGANVGALIDAGQAYLFLGAATPPASPALTISGSRAYDELGLAVAGVGDLDGDGLADFATGAPGGADSNVVGEARIYRGRTVLSAVADTVLNGESAGDMFGHTLSNGAAGAGGPGDDFLVGSYLHGAGGRAYLFGAPATALGVPPDGPRAGADRLEPPWPNPSRGSLRLGFELARSGRVRIEVVDAAGRRVANVADGVVAAGRHQIEWTAPALRRMPGLYFVVLTTEAGRLARRFVVAGR